MGPRHATTHARRPELQDRELLPAERKKSAKKIKMTMWRWVLQWETPLGWKDYQVFEHRQQAVARLRDYQLGNSRHNWRVIKT